MVGTSSTALGSLSPGQVALGATLVPDTFFAGAMCEVLYYSGVSLSTAQIQANEAYLKAKWGTP